MRPGEVIAERLQHAILAFNFLLQPSQALQHEYALLEIGRFSELCAYASSALCRSGLFQRCTSVFPLLT